MAIGNILILGLLVWILLSVLGLGLVYYHSRHGDDETGDDGPWKFSLESLDD